MTLTKKRLAKILSNKMQIPQAEAARDVELLITLVKERLGAGEQVKITRFGLFEVKTKHARLGRNPQTGEAITIKSRRIISFKPSPVLKQAINP